MTGCSQMSQGKAHARKTPYVLWDEEIQYWDKGWFISSGTTRSYLASITMFSLEKRYVRNWGGRSREVRA